MTFKGADLRKVRSPGKIDKIPKHVAIIMDGNGRWAKKRGLPRIAGHREGVKAVRRAVEASSELGIEILTLYTFSTENWNRPEDEVNALMRLLLQTIERETVELIKNNVQLRVLGELAPLQKDIRIQMEQAISRTAANTGLILNLALNYGGREEIVRAIRSIASGIANGRLRIEEIDEKLVSGALYTQDLPDPDLLIRTSGEWRVSNFLLWQIAYTEMYVTPVLWPDFDKKTLLDAVLDYNKRERRFGKVSEQLDRPKDAEKN